MQSFLRYGLDSPELRRALEEGSAATLGRALSCEPLPQGFSF